MLQQIYRKEFKLFNIDLSEVTVKKKMIHKNAFSSVFIKKVSHNQNKDNIT